MAVSSSSRFSSWQVRGYALLAPALVVMLLFFVGAMLILLSFTFQRLVEGQTLPGLTTANYTRFFSTRYYWSVVATTLKLGAVTVACCVLIGYPVAYALDRIRRPIVRNLCYFLLFSPLLTSVVVRSYGWQLVFGDHGLINSTILGVHLVSKPIPLLFEFSGVTIALVHILLPFMVFPIVGVLGQVNRSLLEAAADLGANSFQIFWRITLPLTIQGVVVGCQLVFALTISAFATPSLLGGGRVQVLASLVYTDVGQLNWPLAGVESYGLLVLALIGIVVFNRLLRLTSI